MFSKNNEKLESFIGGNTSFEGNITSKGTLRVDGAVQGNVDVDWLIIGEKGVIKGNIVARGVIVGGTLEGNARVKEIVEIKQKGSLKGDIETGKLTVAEGGRFDGRSMMDKKEDVKAIEFAGQTK